jgi:hypothetical protein
MTFVGFVTWLATPAALAVVSSLVVQVLKRVWPSVQQQLAVAISIAVAAVASVVAMYALPWVAQLPPDVERLWPVVVWALQQLWYGMFGQSEAMRKLAGPIVDES